MELRQKIEFMKFSKVFNKLNQNVFIAKLEAKLENVIRMHYIT